MSQSTNPSTNTQSLEQLQHTVDDDIQKLRDAQSPQTLEEKVADWKAHGIDPSKTFDTRGDEDE